MSLVKRNFRRNMLVVAIAAILPLSAVADEKYDLLQQQVDALQKQLEQVQAAMRQYQEQMTVKEGQVEDEVTAMKADVARAAEWKESDTLVHLAGYADVGYSFAKGDTGDFSVGRFAPIFHYQYRDLVMLEAELEFEVDEAGETELGMEYLTIDYFLNDNVALVAGRFLSPVGQFRQNLHPSWINKIASAPPGFGHDGAAPSSDVGLQARGGFQIGDMFTNYAAYVSNGPELNSSFEDGEFALEGIRAGGLGADADGEKVFGGRFGILPYPGMEIGISVATGKATVTKVEVGEAAPHAAVDNGLGFGPNLLNVASPGILPADPDFDLHDERARSYDVFGMDFVWALGSFQLRGEYVNSKVGAATKGVTASPGANWMAWYAQASYRIPQTKLESVIRYTDFNSPNLSMDQTQWALGLNYLISSNVIGKVTFEYNDGLPGGMATTDRWLFQLAYGF